MSGRPVGLIAALVIGGTGVAWAGSVDPEYAAAKDGHAVAELAQCAACHTTPGIAAPPRTASCDGCHRWVRTVAANPAQRAKAMQFFPNWARYETSVVSYFAVPDLAASFARIETPWLRAYLENPHDLRPAMPESMVVLGLDDRSLDKLAAWANGFLVTPPATSAPVPANLARGEALFTERGCIACHTYGSRHLGPGIPAAPDLRWARERMSDDMIAAWIENPAAISPQATMPALSIPKADILALRDYVVLAEPDAKRVAFGLSRGASAPAKPTWTDVESRVFGKICVHCHMDPAQNEGREGPGNAGGFGWSATGIELQTYEEVVKEKTRVLAALERRYAEEARDHVAPGVVPSTAPRPAKPGMPMGQPALSAADFAMIKAWYAAGAPR